MVEEFVIDFDEKIAMNERQRQLDFDNLMVGLAVALMAYPIHWVLSLLALLAGYGYRYRHDFSRFVDGVRCVWQRFYLGIAYTEAWNLNSYIARYALPRLMYMRDHGIAIHFADNAEESEAIMGDIIYALDVKVRDDWYPELVTKEERDDMYAPDGRYNRGMDLFGEHWRAM